MNSRTHSEIGLLGLTLSALLITSTAEACAAGGDPRPTIWDILRRRNDAAATAEVVWKQTHIRAGMAASRPGEERSDRDGGVLSKEIVSPQARSRLVLSGEHAYHETLVLSYVGNDEGEFVRGVNAFNGDRQQHFTEASERKGPTADLQQLDEFDEWQNVHLLALTLALRPLRDGAFGPRPDQWQVENRPAVVDGRECLVLVKQEDHGRIRRIYVDAARGYLPLRLSEESFRRPSVQIDMQYDRTEPPDWVPSSWTAIFHYAGMANSFEKSQNELEDVTLGGPVEDSLFTIDFPSGTELTTNIPGLPERLVVKDGQWIPRRQAQAEASGGASMWLWLLAAAGAIALVVALLLALRRRSTAEG